MKVKYLGVSDPLELLNGKVYDVVSVEGDWYRIVDETHEDYLYPPECFEIVEPRDESTPVFSYEECAQKARLDRAKEGIWNDFQDGETIGQEGSESGLIIYDVEFIHRARVTIEETTPIPFSITCGIYGLIVHTTFASSKEEAIEKAFAIQGELADCITDPPSDEGEWCEKFVMRW